jgi:hypothetical protein
VRHRMQACYVNTTHPDFINGHKVHIYRLFAAQQSYGNI